MSDTPETIRAQITRLVEGESYSRSSRLAIGTLNETSLREEMERLRNGMQTHAHRAKRDTGNTYVIEVGTWHTRSLHMMVTCVVTCVAFDPNYGTENEL